MTLERAVNALCKDVVANSPLRKRLNAALREFRSHENADLGLAERRQQIEYQSSKVSAQFLGWLLLDQVPPTEALPVTAAALTADERDMFGTAHRQLLMLNRKCVAKLIERFPNCREVLDVYSQYVELPIPSGEGKELLFSDRSAENVISAFSEHADVARAALLPFSFILRFPPHDIMEMVRTTEQRLQKAGVFAAPDDLEQIERKYTRDAPLRQLTRFSVALCGIRASLMSLNQMVYQAVLNDKPPIFDDRLIFGVEQIVTHRAGTGLRLKCQFFPFIDYRDVVLLKPIGEDQPFGGWAVIWGSQFEVSEEFGAMMDVRLRLLNSDLSPYGNAAGQL